MTNNIDKIHVEIIILLYEVLFILDSLLIMNLYIIIIPNFTLPINYHNLMWQMALTKMQQKKNFAFWIHSCMAMCPFNSLRVKLILLP